MPTLKITILEKDGVEYDYPTEMDLASALTFIGFTGGISGGGATFNEDSLAVDYDGNVVTDCNGNIVRGD
jgi:hypothetical protein